MNYKYLKSVALLLLTASLFNSCKKEEGEEIDTTYPLIDIAAADAFPKQCSVIRRGQPFVFKAQFTDNAELGSVSIDIHHNFDHHTHSTEVDDCGMDPVKVPVMPYKLIQSYPIPAGQKTYQSSATVTIPADADPGDYHFMIRVTDKAGWQTIRGLSVKVQ